ncbi:MAG: ABC-F family ATP-binding cassette domain-containing protein [Rhodothermaceae bacterium]|nr:ABC-F family ATP-binding cassette domain-containing protein [Rhodothermaceae bacterium]
MTYLSVENLSKHYGMKVLFDGLTFGISKGNKMALIARNGTGKSSLLHILAGFEKPDDGQVMVRNGIRIGYLEQEPRLDEALTISEFISSGHSDLARIVLQYEKAVDDQAEAYNEETHTAFEKASAAMEAANAWDYEQRMVQILGKLDIHNLDQPIASLSGGERKRVALAFVLLDSPDLLLLDEPTNHLDVEMIEWLESYLIKNNLTLLMVTHDRYFLDRVCNHILEIEGGKLYHHKGNYSYFLQKRAEREEVMKTEKAKAGQLFKKELEWMRRAPKARTTKSKSRIGAFYDTKEKAEARSGGPELRLETTMTRMGSQILELKNVSKRFGDLTIMDKFEYSFSRGERIGIIGKNGVGKTTFLNVITGREPSDSGEIRKGSTIVYGYYSQQGIKIDESQRAIDVLKEVAEVIELANGNRISASQFLEHFMFTSEMQYTPVAKLSGGEKRRLALMMVLIQNPNFLILDEPTNDLDLITLNILEEFLLDFGGCLIVVSHDRFFMDKLVQHYFVFEGDGVIRDFNGNWQEYREMMADEESERKKEGKSTKKTEVAVPVPTESKTGDVLSYAERKEYSNLEKEIASLGEEQKSLETTIGSGKLGLKELEDKSKRYGEILAEIDEKTARWVELADRA